MHHHRLQQHQPANSRHSNLQHSRFDSNITLEVCGRRKILLLAACIVFTVHRQLQRISKQCKPRRRSVYWQSLGGATLVPRSAQFDRSRFPVISLVNKQTRWWWWWWEYLAIYPCLSYKFKEFHTSGKILSWSRGFRDEQLNW